MPYGLIGTCRLNGIDPEAYLRHILSACRSGPATKWLNCRHGT
ncbi:transposase domain-containing protein [Klebsiella pneumoniae]